MLTNIPSTTKTRNIKVTKADEPWNFIHLIDGTIIKTRHIVVGVLQLLNNDGNPIVDETGCVQYAIQHNMIVIIEHSPMIEERQVASGTMKGLN